jgi:hypothetical protein
VALAGIARPLCCCRCLGSTATGARRALLRQHSDVLVCTAVGSTGTATSHRVEAQCRRVSNRTWCHTRSATELQAGLTRHPTIGRSDHITRRQAAEKTR